jgi:hypothetical protein
MKEIVLLAFNGSEGYVGPALDDHGGPAWLAYPSWEEAENAAAFQKNTYGIDCHPVIWETKGTP